MRLVVCFSSVSVPQRSLTNDGPRHHQLLALHGTAQRGCSLATLRGPAMPCDRRDDQCSLPNEVPVS